MNRKKFGKLCILLAMTVVCFVISCTADIDDRFYADDGEVIESPFAFKYMLSKYDGNRKMYADIYHSTVVDAEKSALVLIDVWQDDFLDSLVINNINPLIERFDAKGAKIIYAPSIEAHNKNLSIMDKSIQFLEDELMDDYLIENDIQNLFYVGFDTFYCVLDKQNGIYSVRSRNKDLNLFLIDEGVHSFTKEMKKASIELIKKNDIGVVNFNGLDSHIAYPKNTIKNVFSKTKDSIPPGNNFVIVFKGISENQELRQFEKDLIELNVNYGSVINNKFYYQGKELSRPDYIKILKDSDIRNLYYAGFHLNDEMLWSDFGIRSLYIDVRYNEVENLPWPYIVTDLAFMAPSEAMDIEVEKATIINHCRIAHNVMSTTLLNELKQVASSVNRN